jgi:hypothetical protein
MSCPGHHLCCKRPWSDCVAGFALIVPGRTVAPGLGGTVLSAPRPKAPPSDVARVNRCRLLNRTA